MKRFEYKVITPSEINEEVLNVLGNQGWEICCCISSLFLSSGNGNMNNRIILKREVN